MEYTLLIMNEAGVRGGGAENRVRSIVSDCLTDTLFKKVIVLSSGARTLEKKRKRLVWVRLRQGWHSMIGGVRLMARYRVDLVQIHNVSFYHVMALLYCWIKCVPVVFFLHDFWPLTPTRCLMAPDKEYLPPGDAQTAGLSLAQRMKRDPFLCMGWRTWAKYCLIRWTLNHVVRVGIAPGKAVARICEDCGFLVGKWRIIVPWRRETMIMRAAGASVTTKKRRARHLVFVGALLPYKGAWVLAEALHYMRTESFSVHIVGPNQEAHSPWYRDFCASLPKKNTLAYHFHGKMQADGLARILSQADVLVFPSVWPEVFGQVWAEAMAFRVPVIASDTGGVSEYVTGKGLLFRRGDGHDLAEKIDAFFAGKTEDRREAAYAFVSRQCRRDVAYQKLRALYKHVLIQEKTDA